MAVHKRLSYLVCFFSPLLGSDYFLFVSGTQRMERKLFLAATVTCGESASCYNLIRNHFSLKGSPYGGAGKRKCECTLQTLTHITHIQPLSLSHLPSLSKSLFLLFCFSHTSPVLSPSPLSAEDQEIAEDCCLLFLLPVSQWCIPTPAETHSNFKTVEPNKTFLN